jgi:hypothetical protein
MSETVVDDAKRYGELEERIRLLELRLEQLERRAEPIATAPAPRRDLPRVAAAETPSDGREMDIALAGKSLIGLGGAYFLRAITESHLVPKAAGLALGLLYAAGWIYLAFRYARKNERHAATFSMIVAALVAYPLIWEATARFGSFNAAVATIAAVATSAALLWIAMQHDLSAGAWIASSGLIGCTFGVMLATESVAVPLIGLTLSGAAIWEIAGRKGWELAAWPTAIVSWLGALPLILLPIEHRGRDSDGLAVLTLLLVALSYLGVIAARSFRGDREFGFTDIAQSAAVVVVGFAGAARVAAGKSFLEFQVLIAIVTVSVIAYRLAVRQRTPVAAYYFGLLGITSALIATGAVTTPVMAGVLWSIFAVASIVTTRIIKATALVVHTTIYAIAAAIAAGLVMGSMSTISGVGAQAPITYPRMMTAMLLITATVLAFIASESPPRRHARVSRMILLALTLLITIAGTSLIAVRITSSDPGTAAAIRSVIIAIAAVGLALASRTKTFADASYLVYPLLGIGAAKFVVDDFLAGRAATLFVTLAVYGCALLLLARMKRRARATVSA